MSKRLSSRMSVMPLCFVVGWVLLFWLGWLLVWEPSHVFWWVLGGALGVSTIATAFFYKKMHDVWINESQLLLSRESTIIELTKAEIVSVKTNRPYIGLVTICFKDSNGSTQSAYYIPKMRLLPVSPSHPDVQPIVELMKSGSKV